MKIEIADKELIKSVNIQLSIEEAESLICEIEMIEELEGLISHRSPILKKISETLKSMANR